MARKRVPNPNLELLRNWLRGAVRASGLRPYKLAEKAGVAQTTITRFLNGHTNHAPTWDTILKVADAARIDPPELSPPGDASASLPVADGDYRNLIREAVRLADKALTNDPERTLYLPEFTIHILDCLVDLQQRGVLDSSAVAALEVAMKQAALAREKGRWVGNPFSPFRDSSEPQSPRSPSSEVSDPPTPDETDPSPPKQAVPDDSAPPLAA
jgi:transcriptional regulator with XRE-family HTH domain